MVSIPPEHIELMPFSDEHAPETGLTCEAKSEERFLIP
jgi:hypothetical protein